MKAVYREELPGGAMWSMRVPGRCLLRLTAVDAGANVSAVFYNAANPLDRLNLPDTLKALHTAKITAGHVLMSDMGHALVSVTADSLGWHDALGGHIDAGGVAEKFGVARYQEVRNQFHRNARDNFLIELSKHGLGLSDLVANLNFFSRVGVDDSGKMEWVEGHCDEGAFVDLRTEMDVLCVFANCPHPMHPGGDYPRAAVRVEIFPTEAPGDADFCRNFRSECARALELTERLLLKSR